jgi:hypothetical protein
LTDRDRLVVVVVFVVVVDPLEWQCSLQLNIEQMHVDRLVPSDTRGHTASAVNDTDVIHGEIIVFGLCAIVVDNKFVIETIRNTLLKLLPILS